MKKEDTMMVEKGISLENSDSKREEVNWQFLI